MEQFSYEYWMGRFKQRLADTVDTREGTLAHMVMSTTAMCAAQMCTELAIIEDNSYADTAVGEALDSTVKLLSIQRRGATNAVVKVIADGVFEIGDIVVCGNLEYKITAAKTGYYLAVCTTAGIVGNSYVGDVIPKTNTAVINAAITEIVAMGQDTEDDESLRKRYLERLESPICTGNVSYYRETINDITGVGGIKVESAFEGAGTVKVIIVNSDYECASDELIAYVKEYLDPEETSGLGYGIAPIGHKVTVESAESVDINIDVEVNGESGTAGYGMFLRSQFALELKELNKNWDINERIIIRDRMIEDFLFGFDGVKDVNVVAINGQPNRFYLEKNQIVGALTVNGL